MSKETMCKFNKDEICVNADCLACADYCPCSEYEEICKYYEESENNG